MEWISIKDQLPEDECLYITNVGQGWCSQYDGAVSGVKKGNWYFNDENGYDIALHGVKYWIILPSLPEPEPSTGIILKGVYYEMDKR